MSRRTLPQRATRGQPPQYLKEPISPSIKQKTLAIKEQVDPERKEIENRLRTQQIMNLKKYPFCRAVHYFFDLDVLPRVKGHLSYVIDSSNALGNTFSNDVRELNGVTYGSVLNRQMFGLPFCPQSDLMVRKESRFKNVCWGYLFELEDKKYQNDRNIYTLKIILKKLKKGMSTEALRKYEVVRKDLELQQILDDEVSLEDKIQILQERIEAIVARKESNAIGWEPDDRLYYYHSLNQQLHNQILDKKSYLTQEHLLNNIIDNWNLRLEDSYKDIHYYLTKQHALSGMVKLNNQQPISVIKFRGGLKVIKLAADLVAKRCQSMGQTTYYEAKQMVNNIFGFDLILKTQKGQSYSSYQKLLRKKCDEMRKYIAKMYSFKKQTYLKLDKYLRSGILSFKGRTQITGKQYHLILIFYWLCQGLSEISSLLEQFPDLLSLISSDYFVKMYSYLVEVTGSPIVGMLCMAIETLADMFSKPDPFLQARLHFQFEESIGVGLLYAEELEYETEISSRQLKKLNVIIDKLLLQSVMQFQLAAQAAVQGNSDIQQLILRLNQKQQRCLREANDKEKDECLAKRLHFETYLSQYIYQYKEKGRKMCGESIREVEGLAEKTKAKNDCVTFYNKSLSIFEGNVRNKLRSLVDNLDFSQL